MIALDSGDKIQGDASTLDLIDYTIYGLDGTTIKQLADGQLAGATGDLYTADSADAVVTIILVNTHTSALTCNLYVLPSAGTARRIIPKDTSLAASNSLHTNGSTVTIMSASGGVVTAYGAHAVSHTDGTDDVRDATNALKGLATAAQITKLEGIESSADVTDEANVTASFPISDATTLVKDPADATKLVRIDAGNITTANTRVLTMADVDVDLGANQTKLDGVEAGADVTDATNVDAAGAVMETDFNAQTILAATTDDTPAALTVGEQTVVGRVTAGNVAALTAAQLTDIVEAATDTNPGKVELATGAETNTGTDATRAVTPDGLDDWTGSAQITTVGTLASGDADAIVTDATTTAKGKVELAIASEVNTGTSTALAVTPDALAGSIHGEKMMYIKVLANDTALTTGDGKAYVTIPDSLNGMNLVDADAAVYTVSSSGTPTIQIHNLTDAADMLSTLITIDASEFSSYTAATPPVIDGAADDVVTGDRIRIDVDVAGTDTTGLDVILTFATP